MFGLFKIASWDRRLVRLEQAWFGYEDSETGKHHSGFWAEWKFTRRIVVGGILFLCLRALGVPTDQLGRLIGESTITVSHAVTADIVLVWQQRTRPAPWDITKQD